MQIVHVQIDEWSADFVGIIEVRDPGWIGDNAFEVSADRFTVLAGLGDFGGELEWSHIRQNMGDQS